MGGPVVEDEDVELNLVRHLRGCIGRLGLLGDGSSSCGDLEAKGRATGFLESASALEFAFPGLYTILYSYSTNFSLQRSNLDVGSFTEFIQINGRWSVKSVNFRPYTYGRKYCPAKIIARHSFSIVE